MPFSSARVGLVCLFVLLAPSGASAKSKRSLGKEAAWTYRSTGPPGEQPYGPGDWHLGYPDCASNTQSPINMASDDLHVTTTDDFTLTFTHNSCNSSDLVFQADFAVWQVYLDGCADQPHLTFQNETYNLLQFHIHSPSENTFGGGEYAADIHMVHTKEETGDLLVVGIMFEVSEYGSNVELQNLWQVLGMGHNVTDTPFETSIYGLLPASPTFSTFSGSLTTPPCSEGVTWIVMNEPVVMSKKQLEEYRHSVASFPGSKVDEFGNTKRSVQALNGRDLFYVTPVA